MAESKAKKPGLWTRIRRFFKDLVGEMKKVSWPTKEQALKNTVVVLIFAVSMAIIIYLFDMGVAWLIGKMFLGSV